MLRDHDFHPCYNNLEPDMLAKYKRLRHAGMTVTEALESVQADAESDAIEDHQSMTEFVTDRYWPGYPR